MSYRCRICSQHFETIPDNAIKIGKGHRGFYNLYMFDDVVHDLKVESTKVSNRNGAAMCDRWHVKRGIKKIGCKFCFPDVAPKPEPVVLPVEEIAPPPPAPEPIEAVPSELPLPPTPVTDKHSERPVRYKRSDRYKRPGAKPVPIAVEQKPPSETAVRNNDGLCVP